MALKDPPIEAANKVPSTRHKFFPHEAINADLWDQYTPYQLLMVVAGEPDDQGDVHYTETSFRYTLPISPQELNLDMPIATTVQATLTGISAQHGGAPFRDIQLNGTTGITPTKNRGLQLRQRGVIESIFAGTVADLRSAGQSALKLVQGGTSHLNVHQGLGTNAEDSERILETTTGYYQMRLMEQFIEAYIQMKTDGTTVLAPDDFGSVRDVDIRKLRLAFCMWKDQAVYLVEPMRLQKRRSAQSPMEYMFTLQLRAYKRISLSRGNLGHDSHQFAGRKPSVIAQIFNRFRAARELLGGLGDVVESIVSDPVNLLAEAMRETSLFLAEVSGVKASLSDFPNDINDDALTPIRNDWRSLRNRFLSLISPELDRAMLGQQPLDAAQKQELTNKVLSNLKPDAVRLSPVTRRKVLAEIDRVKKFGRADFETRRNLVIQAATTFAEGIGASNETFAATYNRPAPTQFFTPTDTQMDVMFALNELAIQLDHLAVSSHIDPPVPTSIEYVAGLAEKAGIAFQIPRSKYAVPFPYGYTLEQLSLLYLGDADRWHEIATLNGLRSPYVDEVGFSLALLTNGDRNTVTVSEVLNLFQGQTVWLSANGVQRSKRHISKIDAISSTQFAVTLDGDADLNRFTVAGQAKLEAFLPGTVNSQQSIYIPSQNGAAEDPRTKQIPGVNEFDNLLQVSGVDLLLTPSGDLAITPDGDCRLAYGLANIVQTVKLALATPRGALIQHPDYGLSVPIGSSTADVDANEVLKIAKEMFDRDPMFSGVRSAFVQKNGSTLQITLDVGIAGTSMFVPITVAVKT